MRRLAYGLCFGPRFFSVVIVELLTRDYFTHREPKRELWRYLRESFIPLSASFHFRIHGFFSDLILNQFRTCGFGTLSFGIGQLILWDCYDCYRNLYWLAFGIRNDDRSTHLFRLRLLALDLYPITLNRQYNIHQRYFFRLVLFSRT